MLGGGYVERRRHSAANQRRSSLPTQASFSARSASPEEHGLAVAGRPRAASADGDLVQVAAQVAASRSDAARPISAEALSEAPCPEASGHSLGLFSNSSDEGQSAPAASFAASASAGPALTTELPQPQPPQQKQRRRRFSTPAVFMSAEGGAAACHGIREVNEEDETSEGPRAFAAALR